MGISPVGIASSLPGCVAVLQTKCTVSLQLQLPVAAREAELTSAQVWISFKATGSGVEDVNTPVKTFPVLLLICSLFSAPLRAQVNEAHDADIAAAIETARSVEQTERQAVVARNLTLTSTESEAFWPLYNRYRYEMSTLEDRQVAVITDFAAHYQNLDDAEARRILDEWLAFQSDVIKLQARYVRRFAKVLPGMKLARYYQIENRLDAMNNLAVAVRVPLAQ